MGGLSAVAVIYQCSSNFELLVQGDPSALRPGLS